MKKINLIFFEMNEGIYISLDLNGPNNPVFILDTQIADSLEFSPTTEVRSSPLCEPWVALP